MGEKTKIPWCDHTFSPWWGCENISPGCAHCYAESQANRFDNGLWGKNHKFRFLGDKYWNKPINWNRKAEAAGIRRRVFCASMSDVFEEREELVAPRLRLLFLIEKTPWLDWLVLTKRPEAMRDWIKDIYNPAGTGGVYLDFMLPNLWLGVTIENASFTYRADILRGIPAAVRFISAEPLLGSLFPRDPISDLHEITSLDLTNIDWVIAGAESGPKARPMDEAWAQELKNKCLRVAAENPNLEYQRLLDSSFLGRPAFFYKQQIVAGHKVECPILDGKQWMEFPQ